MGQLVVITFETPDQAGELAKTLRQLESDNALKLEDMRVIVKDAEGKTHVHDDAGHPVAIGAAIGGVIGGFLFIVAPVLGIAAGAAAGAAIAKAMDLDVDQKFVNEVAEKLKPNTSALFVLGSDANQAAVLNALKPYQGTLIQTSLSSDMEAQLRRALSEREP
ncbi:MAG: hypothetical protein HDKAJFGB_03320 [Anaerolineae bacterium]|nr:hypothetical protein [Anaerolineae bacterium]